MFNVSIADARNIVEAIYEKSGLDVSAHTMSSMRLRIGKILSEQNLNDAQVLIPRILDDSDFLDSFIHGISVGSPDMFRDPELWVELRDRLIPDLLEANAEFEILVPASVTGDELYSLAILLNESGWAQKIRLVATCLNAKTINSIQEGFLSQVRHKTSLENYRLFNPKGDLDKYLYHSNGRIYKSSELISQVRILEKKPISLPITNRTKMILFRNRLLYVNQSHKTRILNNITGRMNTGSYLILGIRESLKGTGLENELESVSSDLNIYIKGMDE
jgi:chemotaxis protein methyltransferase CheR